MPSAPKTPTYPNPTQTANTQADFNVKAAQQQQAMSTMGQETPYGSLTYTTSIDPITGLPKYQANTKFTPEQQALLDTLQNTKSITGQGGETLAGNTIGQYETAPDLIGGANSLTQQVLNSQLPAWERFMQPEREQLDTKLRNQGIMPGTPAYQQQVDALSNQQNLTKGQWLGNFEPQAFNQAQTQYQLPLENIQTLMGMSGPADLKSSFTQTPTANVAAPDYSGQVSNQFDAQLKAQQNKIAQQNALMSALFGGATNIAKLPVSGGGSLGGNFIQRLF